MDAPVTSEIVLLTLGLVLSGYVSGIIAGLLGVGGGIILVPVLFQTFVWFDFPAHLQIHMAVGTSLAIICFTGGQSARSHLKRGAVDIKILRSWAVYVGLGALSGALLARLIVPEGLKLIFATLALVLGARMLRGAKRQDETGALLSLRVQKPLAGITGFLSALMGIGGGTLSVPLLGAAGRDMHHAVATSACLSVIIAVPAAVGFMLGGWTIPDLPPFTLGYVNLLALAVMIPASMMGAPTGAHFAHLLSARQLELVFAGFLLLSGTRMILALV
jgi:uncharacterized membrane protein YfcA